MHVAGEAQCFNRIEFDRLKSNQLCNHFPNNQELTTKTGLARNLLRLTDYEFKSESWFPRCYDFTEETQIAGFIQDFQKTAVINFLKKHAKYFETIHKKELMKIKKNQSKNIWKSIYLPINDGNKNMINILLLKTVIRFVKFQIKLRNRILKEYETNKCKIMYEFIIKFNQYNPPYSLDTIKILKQIVPEGWECPSLYLEYKTVSIKEKYLKE